MLFSLVLLPHLNSSLTVFQQTHVSRREVPVLPFQNETPQLQADIDFKRTNELGRKSRFMLPDGTKVWLNVGSTVDYTEDATSRTVTLTGEAFFDVKRDTLRPFQVRSGDLTTTALGTSFNIKCYPEHGSQSVALVTGVVEIGISQDEVQILERLEPGELLQFDKNAEILTKRDFDNLIEFGWREGYLVFSDANYEEVIDRLEKWYGVEIQTSGKPKNNWSYNATFEKESLEEVLRRLSYVEQFEYELNNKYIHLDF